MKHAQWMSTELDAAGYHREIWLRAGAASCCMLLCFAGWLPAWALILCNVVLYPAIYLRVHDVGHGIPWSRYGLAARFVPVANPIWGGTRVFSHVHGFHHSHFGTDQDPWLPYYTGHPLRALFFNLIEPEYSFAEFVRRRGWDRELVLNVVFHGMVTAFGLALLGKIYWLQLVSQRLVHMTGIFFFNFYTHRESFSRSAPIGTWEREAELRRILPLLRWIWGQNVIEGLIFHNRHHCVGQMHIPVQNYRRLEDTQQISRFIERWPIDRIVSLKAESLRSEPR